MIETDTAFVPSQSDIRIACKKRRAQLSPDERRVLSQKIADKIVLSDVFLDATTIAVYLPMRHEVDTWPIIECACRAKKRTFAPITQDSFHLQFRQFDEESEFSSSAGGPQEPRGGKLIDATALDLVLLPLVAFDSKKNRIGMGGGCYDRTFSFLDECEDTTKPILVGLAFECQRVEKIVSNPWDIRLFNVFTETGVT